VGLKTHIVCFKAHNNALVTVTVTIQFTCLGLDLKYLSLGLKPEFKGLSLEEILEVLGLGSRLGLKIESLGLGPQGLVYILANTIREQH